MKIFSKITIILLVMIYCFDAMSQQIKNIDISGNNRVSDSVIKNILSIQKNKNYSNDEINSLQKKLFETNFFKDINFKFINNNLSINVIENPLIDFFFINGVINKKREDDIYNLISLNQNKLFSEYLLKQDIDKIRDIYKQSGFYNVKIVPEITKNKNETINIVINVQRGEKYDVNKIYFNGNKFFSSSDLKNIISSTEKGWWKLFSNTSLLNENRIEYDKFLLKKYYLENGFYDVQITSANVNIPSNLYADITYTINSGKRYLFGQSNIKDEKNLLNKNNITDINELLKKNLKGIYSQKKIRSVRDKIEDYLIINRIDFVNINFKEIKNQDSIDLNILFTQVPGLFVNNLEIKGNTITEESVILRNILFAEGDALTRYKIEKSLAKLKNTQIFKTVDIKKIKINNNNQLTDILITVEEQPTGSVSAGIGVGSDSSAITSNLSEKNLFGKGIVSNSFVSLGTDKIEGGINFLLPDYKNSGNTLGHNLYAKSTDFKNVGYESKAVGYDLSIRYPIYEDVNLKTGIGIENDDISANSSASQTYKSRDGKYITFKGFYTLDNDTRNNVINTTRGHRVGFSQKLGMPGSDIAFLDNALFGSIYKNLNEDYTLNIKGSLNSINSLSSGKDVKLSDRKFLTNKRLRGFESYGIGPKDGKEHVGGNYSYSASVSTTFPNPLPDKWNAKSILFLDAGNVWGVDYDDSLDNDKLRSSTGISIDWISPLGPLSFTFSEVISKANGDKDESFSFILGSTF